MRFRDELIRFMYGRNGFDKLGRFLFIVYIILVICQWIVALFVPPIVSFITSCLIMLLVFYIFFRVFSRNLVKRQAENYKYIQFSSRSKTFFSLQKSKFRDRKTHVYKNVRAAKRFYVSKRSKESIEQCVRDAVTPLT